MKSTTVFSTILTIASTVYAQENGTAGATADTRGTTAAPPLPASETKALKCGTGTEDVSQCYFSGDFCSFQEDFDGNFRATDFLIYEGNPEPYDFVVESGQPRIKDGILTMPLTRPETGEQGQASIVSTTRFLNYGSFEAKLKTVGQSSVVTTFIGISNVLDEIDFEFVPKNAEQHNEAQANWYYRAEPVYNVNFQNIILDTNTFDNWHTYRVDWNEERIIWSADGQQFYTQTKADLGENATRYPATPMRISFGVWQALNNDWAGPNTVDWNGKLDVEFDYVKVIGTECGGGDPAANPPVSAGFLNRGDSANWTPETSSAGGSGAGAGNAFGNSGIKTSALNIVATFSMVVVGAIAYML